MNHNDFIILLTDHKEMIYRVVRSQTGSEQDADDIMQEVLLKIYQGIDSFKGESNVKTWIYRICKNTVADYYRKPWWKFNWLPLINQDNTATTTNGPFEQVAEKQSRRRLNEILQTFPQQQSEIFRLRFVEHLSLQDISEIKDMNLNTIKTHLYRAVKKVRAELTMGG